jgi:hypothetical protein
VSADNPAEKAVEADIASARFRVGAIRGQWRKISLDFPVLIVAVQAIEPDGRSSEYFFRFELTGYPGMAPEVKIWDCNTATVLAPDKRPKGSSRVTEAFKSWGSETVYRPWDRYAGPHNNWTTSHPDLAWHSGRDLAFILEDLHGLLTSNAVAHGDWPAAEAGSSDQGIREHEARSQAEIRVTGPEKRSG